jgi:hypothetical protein
VATRKISFERFQEGDAFSHADIESRFTSIESDLNKTEVGLQKVSIAEGALNYQHLSSPGRAVTSDVNFGSVLIQASVLRNVPGKESNGFQIYDPDARPVMKLEGTSGPGWSGTKGVVIGGSSFHVHLFAEKDFAAKRMQMSLDGTSGSEGQSIKLGSNFQDDSDPGYAAGVLIMFNVFCYQANRNGTGFELQFRDQEGNWNPIIGAERWLIQLSGRNILPDVNRKSPWTGSDVNIRVWLSGDRAKSLATSLTTAQKRDLEIQGIRAKMCVVDATSTPASGPSYRLPNNVLLGGACLTALAFRGVE